MLETVLVPVLIVTVVGIIAATILSIASKFMAVPVDETVLSLRDALPGANCGACGCAGCDEYAEKMAKGECPTNLCVPGGASVATKLSGILGT
ncbi:MAG: (Fe-S)-binding protein, partial [Oscillospiraceae bacterium]